MLKLIMFFECFCSIRGLGLWLGRSQKLSLSPPFRTNAVRNIRTNVSSTRSGPTISTEIAPLSDDIMRSILYRIRQCNIMPRSVQSSLMDFKVDGRTLGKVFLKDFMSET